MSTQAKVTQEQADAYLDGWIAAHNQQKLSVALQNSKAFGNDDLTKIFNDGYGDSAAGRLDFNKMMGPDDFEPEGP